MATKQLYATLPNESLEKLPSLATTAELSDNVRIDSFDVIRNGDTENVADLLTANRQVPADFSPAMLCEAGTHPYDEPDGMWIVLTYIVSMKTS